MTDSDSSPTDGDIQNAHKRLSGGNRRSSGGSAGRKVENPFQKNHEMIRQAEYYDRQTAI